MGLFARNSQRSETTAVQIIDPESMGRLPAIGLAIFGTPPQIVDVSGLYLPGFLAAGSPIEGPAWDRFVCQFLAELSAIANPDGGWASAGAFHVAKDFVKSEDWTRPEFVALMDHALEFLANAGVDASVIPNFALSRFNEFRGTLG